MKWALRGTRLVVEALFGLICIAGGVLLPALWGRTFPVMFLWSFYLALLRHHSRAASHSTVLIHYDPAVSPATNAVATIVGLLIVTCLCVSGVLWFRDVFVLIRRHSRTGSGT